MIKYCLNTAITCCNGPVPPPFLNPIEMAWASIKGYVSSKHVQWNLKREIELVTEKVNQMGPNEWKDLFDKTKEN